MTNYLEKYPLIETFPSDSKRLVLNTLEMTDHFLAGTSSSFTALRTLGNTLEFETFQSISGHLDFLKMSPDLRDTLECLIVLEAYTLTPSVQMYVRPLPNNPPEHYSTEQAAVAYVVLQNDRHFDDIPMGELETLRNVLRYGFDVERFLRGELPAIVTEDFHLCLGDHEKRLVLAHALMGLAARGVLTEQLARDYELLHYYRTSPCIGHLFYEVHARRIQNKGFNRRLSMAAARLGLMIGVGEDDSIDIATHLLRTFPAYETIIQELSMGVGELNGERCRTVPLVMKGVAELLQNTYNWYRNQNDARALRLALDSALPIIQHAITSARIEFNQLGDHADHPNELDLTTEAELAKNGPLSLSV
ncbi:hypothetical protein IJJ37_02245 [Candidatus Saccharibacteria bacterium]|nr:hypothetical protein [Candidatus Saccharibacteria bacterium]